MALLILAGELSMCNQRNLKGCDLGWIAPCTVIGLEYQQIFIVFLNVD